MFTRPLKINGGVRSILPHVQSAKSESTYESYIFLDSIQGGRVPPDISSREVALGDFVTCPHASARVVCRLLLHEDSLAINPLLWGGKKHLTKLQYGNGLRGTGKPTLHKRIGPPFALVWIEGQHALISVGVSDKEVVELPEHVVEDGAKLDEGLWPSELIVLLHPQLRPL